MAAALTPIARLSTPPSSDRPSWLRPWASVPNQREAVRPLRRQPHGRGVGAVKEEGAAGRQCERQRPQARQQHRSRTPPPTTTRPLVSSRRATVSGAGAEALGVSPARGDRGISARAVTLNSV